MQIETAVVAMDLDAVEYRDEELVAKAQQADGAAFGELVRRTANSSHRLARSILKNHHLAEEEVQNAYFNAWRHICKFDGRAKFSTWISRIVVNQCLMRLRSHKVANSVSADFYLGAAAKNRVREVVDQNLSPEGSSCKKEELNALKNEISRLPPILRSVLVLRDIRELSTIETSVHLGISLAAVKSRLLRARSELRQRLATDANRWSIQ